MPPESSLNKKQMKHILLSILTLTCLQSHAQNITGIHTLRIGDDITKQLVEYEQNAESAKNVVWDLRGDRGTGTCHETVGSK